MKKTNAVLTLILTPVIIIHLITASLQCAFGCLPMSLVRIPARAAMLFFLLHAALSFVILFFRHDGACLSKYGKLNRRTVMQRASALMMTLTIHFHTGALGLLFTGEPLSTGRRILITVVELLFFESITSHLSFSFSRALITMGLLRSEKTEKQVDGAARIATILLLLTACICVLSRVWTV